MAEPTIASMKVLPPDFPEAVGQTRYESRRAIVLPLFFTTGSGETIPAVILNVSASGLLALVDVRFSPLLPPPCGARLEFEFFLDEVEVHHAVLEVLRIEKRGDYLIALGCRFVHIPAEISAALRAKVSPRSGKNRR